MTPKEKAIEILGKINGQPLNAETWEKASDWSKQELKRKALCVADEVLTELYKFYPGDYALQRKEYWESVKQEINKQ